MWTLIITAHAALGDVRLAGRVLEDAVRDGTCMPMVFDGLQARSRPCPLCSNQLIVNRTNVTKKTPPAGNRLALAPGDRGAAWRVGRVLEALVASGPAGFVTAMHVKEQVRGGG